MSSIWILTLIIAYASGGAGNGTAAISQEYSTKLACEDAKEVNRQALDGSVRVVLLTCTRK